MEETEKITELEPRIIMPFFNTYTDALANRLAYQQGYANPNRTNQT